MKHEWECFTCRGCGKAVRRHQAPNSPWRLCQCCSFLDTVHDARMREALRTVFEQGGDLTVEPRPDWRFGNQPRYPGGH